MPEPADSRAAHDRTVTHIVTELHQLAALHTVDGVDPARRGEAAALEAELRDLATTSAWEDAVYVYAGPRPSLEQAKVGLYTWAQRPASEGGLGLDRDDLGSWFPTESTITVASRHGYTWSGTRARGARSRAASRSSSSRPSSSARRARERTLHPAQVRRHRQGARHPGERRHRRQALQRCAPRRWRRGGVGKTIAFQDGNNTTVAVSVTGEKVDVPALTALAEQVAAQVG